MHVASNKDEDKIMKEKAALKNISLYNFAEDEIELSFDFKEVHKKIITAAKKENP